MAEAEVKVAAENAGWMVVASDQQKVGPFHRHRDARDAARRLVQDAGGGEIIIRARSGRIVGRQRVPPRRAAVA